MLLAGRPGVIYVTASRLPGQRGCFHDGCRVRIGPRHARPGIDQPVQHGRSPERMRPHRGSGLGRS